MNNIMDKSEHVNFEQRKLTLEEFDKLIEALNKRHAVLMALPSNEWLTKKVQDELAEIHETYFKLINSI